MFKYLLILNLLIMAVITQDIPPRSLPTEAPIVTPTPATTEVVSTTLETEVEMTTSEATNPTIAEEATTTSAPATTTTLEAVTTTPELTDATTTTTMAPISTMRNDIPVPVATDSPFRTTSTTPKTAAVPHFPFVPSGPDYSQTRCYYKKQYGHPQLRWSCNGLKYVYPVECFECCLYGFSYFAACYRVHDDHCNSLNDKSYFYK